MDIIHNMIYNVELIKKLVHCMRSGSRKIRIKFTQGSSNIIFREELKEIGMYYQS